MKVNIPIINALNTALVTTQSVMRNGSRSKDDELGNKRYDNNSCGNEIVKDKCSLCGAEIPIGKTLCDCGARGVEALKKSRLKSNRCSACGIGLNAVECWMNEGVVYCEKCYDKQNNQSAKADADKPILSLVPKQIIYEIEKVRAFGSKKYKDPNNWKKVELERYHQALLRHTLAVWDDINAKDKESGLLHLSHMATNIAFILELMSEE